MYVFLDLQFDSEYLLFFFISFSCSGEADPEHDFEPCQGQKDENANPPQAIDPPQDVTPQDASQLANDERPPPNASPCPSISDPALEHPSFPGKFGKNLRYDLNELPGDIFPLLDTLRSIDCINFREHRTVTVD